MTSSRSEGKIFRVRRPSENLSKTPVSPFMNETFSSLVFAVKLERSKKLRVDIGKEEKKGCDGRDVVEGLPAAWRVTNDLSSARKRLVMKE